MPPGETFLYQYPETDLVEYHRDHNYKRRIPYLSPIPSIAALNFDDEFKREALEHAKREGWNPIQFELGNSPLFIETNASAITLSVGLIPHPQTVPVLPVLAAPTSIASVERVNARGNTTMCTVKVASEWFHSPASPSASDVVLFKIFRDTPWIPEKEKNDFSCIRHKHGLSRRLFEAEKAAYQRLIYHGVVAAGAVPSCYGWFCLTADIPGVMNSPMLKRLLEKCEAEGDKGPPRVLVFEFIPNAERVSIHNVSPQVAKDALAALQLVHRAFILHRDIVERNVLVRRRPDDTYHVYIVDFDSAVIANGESEPKDPWNANRATLMLELNNMWELFFRFLIPNQLIGYDSGMPQFSPI